MGACCPGAVYPDRTDLTSSWKTALPQRTQDRYDIVETRNAAAILKATNPDEFQAMCDILDTFELTLRMLLTKGGNKTPVAANLDEAFRVDGWREAKYEQRLETRLVINPYRAAGEKTKKERHSVNESEGHQVDNVKGRVALDVEWNAKDGNLDRDVSNFRALYEAGEIDAAVLVTRTAGKLRDLAYDQIHKARKEAEDAGDFERLRYLKTIADDPLKSTTTTNMDKLVPRLQRGDGGGCPILAIGITERCYVAPTGGPTATADAASTVTAAGQDDDIHDDTEDDE